jgi:hypothetical protein
MLQAIHDLIQTFVVPMNDMGLLIGTTVTSTNPAINNMPLSTAALSGFLMPWVNDLGNIVQALATFLQAL